LRALGGAVALRGIPRLELLPDPGDAQDLGHGLGRLGAVLQPVERALVVDEDGRGIVERVVLPQVLDEPTVARRTRVRSDDAVVGTLLGAFTAETELDGHGVAPTGGCGHGGTRQRGGGLVPYPHGPGPEVTG